MLCNGCTAEIEVVGLYYNVFFQNDLRWCEMVMTIRCLPRHRLRKDDSEWGYGEMWAREMRSSG